MLQPIIFGEHTAHSQIKVERAKPISAGFFYINGSGITVNGESVSLKLKSQPIDIDLLKLVLANAGTMFFI